MTIAENTYQRNRTRSVSPPAYFVILPLAGGFAAYRRYFGNVIAAEPIATVATQSGVALMTLRELVQARIPGAEEWQERTGNNGA